MLDIVEYLHHETDVWFELTTLLIPGQNDSDAEIEAMSQWIMEHVGPDLPLHFTAFHPDFKMQDIPPTPPRTLTRARRIAMANGLNHVYTGNVHDRAGGSTYCTGCGAKLIGRDWYELTTWELDAGGSCRHCGTRVPGIFSPQPGMRGRRRMPVNLAAATP